jgi:ketosteroid isomerase-like protein
MTTASAIDRNLATIHEIYEAFGKGDVAAILPHMAEDVAWDFAYAPDSPIPWLQGGTGRDHVARFFMTLGTMYEVQAFELVEVLAGERTVVVIFNIDGIVRATGKRITESEETHVWHFNDEGKVARFRHAADTLQQYLALRS